MAKLVFFEIEEWEKDFLKQALPNNTLIFSTNKTHEETSLDLFDAEIISTFIYSKLTSEILSKFKQLKLIATRSTGYDHIDLQFCKEKNIAVVNVPSYGAHTVAEHTFALLLALSRKIIPAVERTKQGDFNVNGLQGFELYGKTLGVVGAGNIGKTVITIALGFGMKVIAFTRTPDESLKQKGVMFVNNLDELIATSDIVTLHVPDIKETHHIINLQNIQKFKKGSILINTARGGLVETQAILEGLDKGILLAAGIDVLEEECNLKEERELLTNDFLQKCDLKTQLLNHILLTKENVIITPHNAFNSKEALHQILQITGENIQSFLDNNPKNLVKS
jgi:D-lactate dehydrogenase